MSASERLRELGEAIPRELIEQRIRDAGWNPDWATPQKLEEVSRKIRLERYDAALPLITDVVREAERQLDESHPDDVDLELSAAVTALREALEEK